MRSRECAGEWRFIALVCILFASFTVVLFTLCQFSSSVAQSRCSAGVITQILLESECECESECESDSKRLSRKVKPPMSLSDSKAWRRTIRWPLNAPLSHPIGILRKFAETKIGLIFDFCVHI